MQKSRKKGIIKHKDNPFLKELDVPISKKFENQEGGLFITHSSLLKDQTESIQTATITKVKNVDKEKFIKLYTDELKHFFNLKPSTQKVLQVILVEVQKIKNKDIIYLDYKYAVEYFCEFKENSKPIISRSTFFKCLKELIENEFIAESTLVNQYFINPKLFFNGSRIKLIKEYRKISPKPNLT